MDDFESTQDFEVEEIRQELPVKVATGKYFSWISSSMTDVGTIRQINEDALLDYPEKKMWVVADGMGGHDAGDVASRTTVSYLRNADYDLQLSRYVDNVEDSLIAANETLWAMGAERGQLAGSTVVALLAHEQHCLVIWAGDSRLYRHRQGRLQQVTRDHSHVEELIALGLLGVEEAESHPKANVITRAVGAGAELFLEMDIFDVQNGDCFLLCSDGLYKDVSEEEIFQVLDELPPSKATRKLIELALSRGARDNVTVVVVQAQARV